MRFIALFLVMSSIAQGGLISPSPVPLTAPDYQTMTVATIQNKLNSTLRGAASGFNSVYNLIWNNPNLTPQQVFDAFGNKACLLVTAGNNFQSTTNALMPGAIPSPSYTVISNGDCTVTVGSPVPSPSPSGG